MKSELQLDDLLVAQALCIGQVEEHRSRFADVPALRIGSREFLHFDRRGLVDLRLTRRVIRAHRESLATHPSTRFRGDSSDWINFELKSEADVEFVVSLLQMAIEANRR